MKCAIMFFAWGLLLLLRFLLSFFYVLEIVISDNQFPKDEQKLFHIQLFLKVKLNLV